MPNCKSCGAEIIWKRTRNGKNIPLDANSEERRAFILKSDPETVFIADAYVVHWETCPDADQHRRGRE